MDTQAQQDLRNILQAMKKAQLAAGPASMALRRDRLQRSVRLIQENHQALADAISADFAHSQSISNTACRYGYHHQGLAACRRPPW
jgi:coniferyl-aldehyde dehydrogenase